MGTNLLGPTTCPARFCNRPRAPRDLEDPRRRSTEKLGEILSFSRFVEEFSTREGIDGVESVPVVSYELLG